MGLNHTIAGNPCTELRVQTKSLQTDGYALENELENRIKILDKLVDSIRPGPDQVSFSGKPHALDLVNDLRVKIKANRNIVRVAKLLSEPARGSMFSKIGDSLNDLEEVIASQLGVKTN